MPLITRVTIGQHQFFLTTEADVARFEAEALAAVRGGGGIVDVPAAGDESVRAIVSPGVPVIIGSRQVEDRDDDLGPGAWPVFLDEEQVDPVSIFRHRRS